MYALRLVAGPFTTRLFQPLSTFVAANSAHLFALPADILQATATLMAFCPFRGPCRLYCHFAHPASACNPSDNNFPLLPGCRVPASHSTCPFPRMWSQPSPTEAAVPLHVPDFAALCRVSAPHTLFKRTLLVCLLLLQPACLQLVVACAAAQHSSHPFALLQSSCKPLPP